MLRNRETRRCGASRTPTSTGLLDFSYRLDDFHDLMGDLEGEQQNLFTPPNNPEDHENHLQHGYYLFHFN
jgi:hypothetical protein